MLTMGVVQEVRTDGDVCAILVECDSRAYEFYLTQDTWLVDGAGYPAVIEDFIGRMVVVVHDEAMTMSLPPKAAAMAVMVYDSVVPNFAVIESVQIGVDGSATVTTDNGERMVTILADAEVSPFRTRHIVTIKDLRAGDAVVLYYDVLAPSIPSRASTAKVVLLEAAM